MPFNVKSVILHKAAASNSLIDVYEAIFFQFSLLFILRIID